MLRFIVSAIGGVVLLSRSHWFDTPSATIERSRAECVEGKNMDIPGVFPLLPVKLVREEKCHRSVQQKSTTKVLNLAHSQSSYSNSDAGLAG